MNKSELVNEITKNTTLTQKVVAETIDSFMDIIKKILKKGDKITLAGFGTFKVSERKATTGINPQTTANALIKFGAGLQTLDFEFFDTQVWGLAVDPSTPSLEWGTSQVGQDVILTIIGYEIYL